MTTTQTLKKGLALTLCAVIALNGCTRTNNVKPDPDLIAQQVKVGDEVKITTHSGEEFNFWVREVGEDALSGSEQQHDQGEHYTVAYDDIASIEVHGLDGPKTTAIVLGVLLLIAAIVALRSADPLFGPACC